MSAPKPVAQERALLLFGGGGLLGSAIRAQVPARSLSWAETSGLGRAALEERVRRLVRPGEALDVVFANGLTDPRADLDALRASNVDHPRRVMELLEPWPSTRFLTFGSVFEQFEEAVATNGYYRSKRELSSWMLEQEAGRFLHLQLHTLYGARLNPRMFLGQMITALRAGERFRMTSGRQFREYHHAEDVAAATLGLCRLEWPARAVQELSSGKPIRLADLARAVFDTAKRPDLLEIGALPHASGENMERVFAASPSWLLPRSRDPIASICSMVPGWLP